MTREAVYLAASEVAERIRAGQLLPDAVRLTDTVRLRNLDGAPLPRALCTSRPRFTVQWLGPSTVPVFALENCRDVVLPFVDVQCEAPCEAVVVIERTRNDPGTIPSTMHGFARWRITGNVLTSVAFWCRASVDANNEHMELHANAITGVARPFVFEGQQSKHHRLTHNVIERYDVGVTADSAFDWQGGTMSGGRHAFELARVGDPVRIAAVGVEATERLLVTAGPTTDAQTVALEDVRYEADQLHPDGDAIVVRHAGTVSIERGRLGGGAQPIPFIRLAGIGEQSLHVRGVHFGSFGASRHYPIRKNIGVRSSVPLHGDGCTFERPQGAPERTATSVEVA